MPRNVDVRKGTHLALLAAAIYDKTRGIMEDGTARTKFTSHLIDECIEGTDVLLNEDLPALSKVELTPDLRMRVEILKHMTYGLVIESPRLKTVEYRGYEIVREIFRALSSERGDQLLPDDYRERVVDAPDELARDRAVCDFIAGMTDRYAIEFYGRLRSESAQTIFKPL